MRRILFLFIAFCATSSLEAQNWRVVLTKHETFSFVKSSMIDELQFKISLIDAQGNEAFDDIGIDGIQVTHIPKNNSTKCSFKDHVLLLHEGLLYTVSFIGDTVLVSRDKDKLTNIPDLSLHNTLSDISLHDLSDSTIINMQHIEGQYDYVVVSAWSSRCAPCLEKLPYFKEYIETADHKILFVHVCPEKEIDVARKILSEVAPPGHYAWSDLQYLQKFNLNRGFPAVNLYDAKLGLIKCFGDIEDVFNFLTLQHK
jgi:hypothetical protein